MYLYNRRSANVHRIIFSLMTDTETVFETVDFYSELTPSVVLGDFIMTIRTLTQMILKFLNVIAFFCRSPSYLFHAFKINAT